MRRDYFSSGFIGVSLIVSILVAWVAILVPSHAATSLRSTGMSVVDPAGWAASNVAGKSDQLALGRNRIDYRSAPEPANVIKASKVPAGCETAFGSRARSEKDAVRCIT